MVLKKGDMLGKTTTFSLAFTYFVLCGFTLEVSGGGVLYSRINLILKFRKCEIRKHTRHGADTKHDLKYFRHMSYNS